VRIANVMTIMAPGEPVTLYVGGIDEHRKQSVPTPEFQARKPIQLDIVARSCCRANCGRRSETRWKQPPLRTWSKPDWIRPALRKAVAPF